MTNKLQKVKVVAFLVSPLLLSLSVLFILYLAFFPTLSPYLKAVNLILSDREVERSEADFENIFSGYDDRHGQVIDANDITYPARGDLYAKISIAAVGMESNLYFDDSDAALSRGGVGQSYKTRIPGYGTPILISGHNNGKMNALQHVKVGDVVTITTNYGIFEYQVRECAVKNSKDPGAVNLKQDKEELILYTCYPFSMLGLTQQRYFVYADKISGPMVIH